MTAGSVKEIRFTRSGQAPGFWIGAAMCVGTAVMFWAVAPFRPEYPELPSAWWSLPFLLMAILLGRLAWRLTSKAYVILTPLGVEIFPFFRPAAGMKLINLGEIVQAEADGDRRLTLHFNREKSAGIHLSLAPVRADRRAFLVKAVETRIRQKDNS